MRSQRLPIIVGDEIIFDVIGADPEGEDEDDDSEEELDDEDLDEDEDDDDDDSDDDDEDSVESLKVKLAEAERLRAKAEYRMKAADRAKTNAEAKLKKATTGGDASAELAAANDKIAKLEQQIAEASGQDTAAIVREEFRDLADYSWHNPKVAFSMLNLDEVEVEDGKVDMESLKYATEELAKEHPYLLKEADGKPSKKSDDDSKDKRESRNPTGINPRRRKKSTDREALKKKYPSLRSRG